MKYANTDMINGIELVVTVLPLSQVPGFDPENPPQANTYGVPDDVEVGWEKRPDGTFVPHTPTAAEILAEKKHQRQAIVDAITVTTSTGKVFDGNEDAIRRLTSTLKAADITGLTECVWVLANDEPTPVTKAELEEALALSVQAMGAIWAEPYL